MCCDLVCAPERSLLQWWRSIALRRASTTSAPERCRQCALSLRPAAGGSGLPRWGGVEIWDEKELLYPLFFFFLLIKVFRRSDCGELSRTIACLTRYMYIYLYIYIFSTGRRDKKTDRRRRFGKGLKTSPQPNPRMKYIYICLCALYILKPNAILKLYSQTFPNQIKTIGKTRIKYSVKRKIALKKYPSDRTGAAPASGFFSARS